MEPTPTKLTPTPTSKALELLSRGAVASPEVVALRKAGTPEGLSKEMRRAMLEDVRAGKVVELEVDAVVFQQSKAPRPLLASQASEANRNHVYVRKSDLKRLAKAYKGRPFLRDHDRHNLLARGGTITRSELVETDTAYAIEQTLHVVKPWAVEAALDGTLTDFSIGFDPATLEDVRCTVCKAALLSAQCFHMPGQALEVAEGKEPRIVEAEYRNPIAAEVSGVSFPAVEGTSVEGIKSAILSARTIGSATKKGGTVNEQVKIELGLSADATDDECKRAIAELKSKAGRIDQVETENKDHAQSLEGAKSVIRELQAQLATERKVARDKRAAELGKQALERGLWAKNSKQEGYFQKLAAKSIEEAEEYFATLEPILPVGDNMQSERVPERPTDEKTVAGYLSVHYGVSDLQATLAEETFRKAGITPEKLAKYGPQGRV